MENELIIELIIFIIGICIGSFLNVVIYRVPKGENIAYPPSHCPKCGEKLKPWHNLSLIHI
jgi:leader peptidase (prepilin peptidase)/N-methyltransferase